jgi:hypothetical protein
MSSIFIYILYVYKYIQCSHYSIKLINTIKMKCAPTQTAGAHQILKGYPIYGIPFTKNRS